MIPPGVGGTAVKLRRAAAALLLDRACQNETMSSFQEENPMTNPGMHHHVEIKEGDDTVAAADVTTPAET